MIFYRRWNGGFKFLDPLWGWNDLFDFSARQWPQKILVYYICVLYNMSDPKKTDHVSVFPPKCSIEKKSFFFLIFAGKSQKNLKLEWYFQVNWIQISNFVWSYRTLYSVTSRIYWCIFGVIVLFFRFGVAGSDRTKVEQAVRNIFKDNAPSDLTQKFSTVHPMLLLKEFPDLKLVCAVQSPGTAVVTTPGACHVCWCLFWCARCFYACLRSGDLEPVALCVRLGTL